MRVCIDDRGREAGGVRPQFLIGGAAHVQFLGRTVDQVGVAYPDLVQWPAIKRDTLNVLIGRRMIPGQDLHGFAMVQVMVAVSQNGLAML